MPRYFDFDVSLREVRPRIWRRFLLLEKATFLHLHEAIQEACGWKNYHLFRFHDRKSTPIAGIPDDEFGEPDPDAKRVKLASYFNEADTCLYEYDFGDSWEHDIKLKGMVERPEKFARMLLGGKRAFPPEDCGGIPGYQECVRVARGGKDPDGLRKWMQGWKPEEFDLQDTARHFDQAKLSLRGHYDEVF